MKKLFIVFIALLSLAANYAHCRAASTTSEQQPATYSTNLQPIKTIPVIRGKGWKTSERFEISNIEGFQEACNAEEQIIFHVEGKSEQMNVDEASGFEVAATIYDRTRKAGHHADKVGNRAEVEYDPGKRAWQVKLTAPKVSNDNYAIVVSLYCREKDSPCATTYGYGTQINKILQVKVR
jgi:hypothetical protein